MIIGLDQTVNHRKRFKWGGESLAVPSEINEGVELDQTNA